MARAALKKFFLFLLIIAGFITVVSSVTFAAPDGGGNYALFRGSVGTGDIEGDGSSFHGYTSYDGRFLAFESNSKNWVYDGPPELTNQTDIFLRDLQTGITKKITISDDGEHGDEKSFSPTVSFDGRYTVYFSYARNLVPGDTNGDNPWEDDGMDVFLYDRINKTTKRVNLNYAGEQINGESNGIITGDGNLIIFASNGSNVMSPNHPTTTHIYVRDWRTGVIERISNSIDGQEPSGGKLQMTASYDGQFIAYTANASNLAPNDYNNTYDVFLYNRQTGVTTLVSRTPGGISANDKSVRPQLTPGGEFLVFASVATNLVPGDTNNAEDIFLYEVATHNIRRISLTENGLEANGDNREPTICEGGRFVAWTADATNLISGDNNGVRDIYFYDVFKDQIRLASVNMSGSPANGNAHRTFLSPDCRYIVFASDATNIVPNDTNENRDIFMGRLIWPFNLNTSTQSAPPFAEPGQEITYRVSVRNSGLETDSASFFAAVPAHTTYVPGSGTNGLIYNSTLNRVEWSGTVAGESEIVVTFRVLVEPGLTQTLFLTLTTQLTGDDIDHTLENRTVVNGYLSMLPAFFRNQ